MRSLVQALCDAQFLRGVGLREGFAQTLHERKRCGRQFVQSLVYHIGWGAGMLLGHLIIVDIGRDVVIDRTEVCEHVRELCHGQRPGRSRLWYNLSGVAAGAAPKLVPRGGNIRRVGFLCV